MAPDEISASDIFECKQCGDCCTGYGGTYVTEKDIHKIAGYIKANPETFIEKYCQISGSKPVLKVSENGKCIFFDEETQCTIHPVKPRMCRAWPFIENILKAPENWEIMAKACPGIRTSFSHEKIKSIVKNELDALNDSRKE